MFHYCHVTDDACPASSALPAGMYSNVPYREQPEEVRQARAALAIKH